MQQYEDVTFFVVEDDDLDFKALTRALSALRISNPVRRAMDGIEALEMLRGGTEAPPLKQPYLIILDLKLPRMGGLEFLAELRADPNLQQSIVFVLTSSNVDSDISEAYRLNAAGFIQKSEPANGMKDALRMIDAYWRVVQFPVNPVRGNESNA